MKKYFTKALFLIMPFFIAGQCPSELQVENLFEEYEFHEISTKLYKLNSCDQLVDSLSLAWHKLGVYYFYYYDQDSLKQAVEATKNAFDIREKRLKEDSLNFAKSANNLGVFYGNLDDLETSEKFLLKALDIFKIINQPRYLNTCLELSRVYFKIGDYSKSLNFLEIANTKGSELGLVDLEASALVEYSNILSEQGDLGSAIDSLNKAKSIFEELEDYYNLTVCYSNLANYYDELEDFQKALFNYDEVLKIQEAFEDDYASAIIYNNIGVTYRKIGQPARAITSIERGKSIGVAKDYPNIIAQSHNNLGEIYLEKKEFTKAKKYFEEAVKTLAPEFDQNSLDLQKMNLRDVTNKVDLISYLKDYARYFISIYEENENEVELKKALGIFRQLDELIDIMRREHSFEETKLFWRKKVKPIYEEALKVCYFLEEYEEAFHFFEKSKSILLLDALISTNARTVIPDSIANYELQLQEELLNERQRLEKESIPSNRALLQEDILAIQQELERFQKKIYEQYPKYSEIKNGFNILSLDEAKIKFTDSTSSLIQCFYGHEAIYFMLIERESNALIRLNNKEEVETAIQEFLGQFKEDYLIINDPQNFEKVSYALYNSLLSPILGSVDNQIQKITIIPDDLISFISFDALVVEEAKNSFSNLGNLSYLLKRYQIQYAYSCSVLEEQATQHNNLKNYRILGLAPFAENNNLNSTLQLQFDELSEIKKSIKGDYLIAEKASKGKFLELGNQYSVLHLSTHGIAATNPSQSYIVLADDNLYLPQLYSSEFNADLVVLSACQTGLGQVNKGEGIMSFARGFTFAGASSLIAGFWNVNAQSTGRILSDFYKNVLESKTKGEALHQAKLDYLINSNIRGAQKSPYYWAGLNFIGTDGKLDLEGVSNNIFLYFLIPSIFIILFYLWKKRSVS